MLTTLELKAKCLARALKGSPDSFGASQAKVAIDTATALLAAKKCEANEFSETMQFLGNHSAIRQWAIQHGFIVAQPDALTNALTEELGKQDKAERDELAKLGQ